jgi:hypothetical protein
MNQLTLTQIRDCVSRGDRAAALNAVRSAINDEKITPRDGIELMLAVRQGSRPTMLEAVETLKWGLPGAYRYVPKADHAFV